MKQILMYSLTQKGKRIWIEGEEEEKKESESEEFSERGSE